MSFSEKLNYYIELVDCTAVELSKVSSLSTSVICRYRKGDRIPKYKSKQFEDIIKGLYVLVCKKKIPNLSYEDIYQDLESCLNSININPEVFQRHFNSLIDKLHVNVSDLSKYMGFDSSYLSKIRTGVRIPQHLDEFAKAIVKYIVDNYNDSNSKETISIIIGCSIGFLEKEDDYYQILEHWIGHDDLKKEDTGVHSFLTKLDEFELSDYIKSIHFDKIKVPTSPIQLPKSKTYYGVEGFKKSQLDVLKAIVLSKSSDNVFFYSNMSMIEGSKDTDFTKKFMIGIAFMLKKGIHLHIIHDLDRPWKELMLGLEGWIPLYMTGQIFPYYFKDNSNSLFSNIECVSNSACLFGSTVTGHMDLARFYVTNKKEEVIIAKKKMELLLKRALPLMDIYTQDRYKELDVVFDSMINITGVRKNIYYNLPIYTISFELLEKILDRNHVNSSDKKYIIKYVEKEKKRISKILDNNYVIDEFDMANQNDWHDGIYFLSLSNIFYSNKIYYTFDEYQEHMKLIKSFTKKYPHYSYRINNKSTFKHINISIIENKQVVISKENDSSIHFVINYPKLVEAIGNYFH